MLTLIEWLIDGLFSLDNTVSELIEVLAGSENVLFISGAISW